jgi:DNA-binding response OmpR family regulator
MAPVTQAHPTARATILVVEDEPDTARLIARVLEMRGHRVRLAASGAAARDALATTAPDLTVLDLLLPDTDGLLLMDEVRRAGGGPILLCTGTAERPDVVFGLRLGAADVLAKPFAPAELQARVEALLRRARGAAAGTPVPPQEGRRGLEVDLRRHRARLDGRSLVLTRSELLLLDRLATGAGSVLSRAELATALGLGSATDPGRTIDKHVSRLRRKLGAAAPSGEHLIESLRGRGYRLAAEAVAALPAAGAAGHRVL